MTKDDFEKIATALFYASIPTYVTGKGKRFHIDLQIVLNNLALYAVEDVDFVLDPEAGTFGMVEDESENESNA